MISCKSPERAAYGWQRDGGHADFLLAEARTLVHLPDALTYVDGALVACGFGTAYQGVVRADVSGRDRVLVVGLGPVGLSAVMLAAASGAEVIATDIVEERLSLAKALGAHEVVLGGPSALDKIRDHTRGDGVEVAIDCSGSQPGRHLCLEAARDWGRIVFIGEGGTITFEPSPLLIHKRLSLFGSWVCGLVEMEELTSFLVRKDIRPERSVTHRFSLQDTNQAYQTFAGGKSGKVVITWD